jgi:hypothetical protein
MVVARTDSHQAVASKPSTTVKKLCIGIIRRLNCALELTAE